MLDFIHLSVMGVAEIAESTKGRGVHILLAMLCTSTSLIIDNEGTDILTFLQ